MLTHVILTSNERDSQPLDFILDGQAKVVIGRALECSLRLEDPTVSRRHCLIAGGEVVWVRDLDSLNGTFVNGQRVGGQPGNDEMDALAQRKLRELHDGDRLQIGTHTYWVRVVTEDDGGCPVESDACAAA